MKISFQAFIILSLVLTSIACGSLINLAGTTTATTTPTNSSESNIQASVTSLVDEINSAASSSTSAASAAISTLVTAPVSASSFALLPHRFQCEETSQSSESFDCDSDEGTMTRSVVFTDCELSNAYFDGTLLNGSFDNGVTHGGAGFCGNGDYILFDRMVLGNDGGDAVHTHQTGANGMVKSFTNARSKTVIVTRTADRTSTFTDPVDEDTDGAAESVTETVDLTATLVRTIDDAEEHNVTVFTQDDSFEALDENGDALTVTVTKPEATLTFDESTHRMEQRTVTSGNLIVDHNLANIRVVFGVGDEGLTHVAGYCDPYEGEMNFTAYEIEDDDTIGAVVGTGTVTYANGSVQTSSFEGTAFTMSTRPCE